MRRRVTPAAIVFAVCLVLSLSVHLPVYTVLGVVKDILLAEEGRRRASGGAEVEFELSDDVSAGARPEPMTPPTPKDAPPKDKDEKKPKAAKKDEPEKPKPVLPPAVMLAEKKPPPAMRPKSSPQAIQQKSQNPDAEPPPDAKYLAEENQRVEEETVARLRSYTEDDADPSASRTRQSAGDDPGNDAANEVADSRDKRGSDERHATEAEAREARPESAKRPVAAAEGDGKREGAAAGGARERAGAPLPEYETITVNDGSGTFVVRVPKVTGREGAQGTEVALGDAARGAGTAAGPEGKARLAGERGHGAGLQRSGPDLSLTWSAFMDAVDPATLEEERRQYAEEKRSRIRGGAREKMWKEFRAAIENFTPAVRPGNQTALNAAASPFANYLTAVHRRIHREFADEFLPSLPVAGGSPLANPDLVTELEIILNRNGTVHRVGIVTPSGVLAFDYGAWVAVMRGQPYPEAPNSILSGDGRAYFHWGFYRNQRQCGTFNAEPFILPNPPGTPEPGPMDGPMPGGIVPRDAAPTWQAPSREGRRIDRRPRSRRAS